MYLDHYELAPPVTAGQTQQKNIRRTDDGVLMPGARIYNVSGIKIALLLRYNRSRCSCEHAFDGEQ